MDAQNLNAGFHLRWNTGGKIFSGKFNGKLFDWSQIILQEILLDLMILSRGHIIKGLKPSLD